MNRSIASTGRVQCGNHIAFAVTVPEVSETDQYDADTLGYVDPLDSFGITHRASLFVLLIGILKHMEIQVLHVSIASMTGSQGSMSTFADFSDILHEPTCSRAYALYVCAADFFYTHIGANANCCNTIEESLARVSGPSSPMHPSAQQTSQHHSGNS